MTYEEFVKGHTETEVFLAGGVTELSKQLGVGSSTIYKVMRGEYVPSKKKKLTENGFRIVSLKSRKRSDLVKIRGHFVS